MEDLAVNNPRTFDGTSSAIELVELGGLLVINKNSGREWLLANHRGYITINNKS